MPCQAQIHLVRYTGCFHTGHNATSFFFLFSINNTVISKEETNEDLPSNADTTLLAFNSATYDSHKKYTTIKESWE